MASSTKASERHVRWAYRWLWAVLVFFIYDISHEWYEDGFGLEIVLETITVVAVFTLLYAEWRRAEGLKVNLGEAQADTQRAQADVLRLSGEFSHYVRSAFLRWGLSRSEQEIAWLLLKGFPFAEIATLRGVQERTVRQQATSIYAKSGCKNRNELVAHFIEDLLSGEPVAELVEVVEAGTPGGDATLSASARAQE